MILRTSEWVSSGHPDKVADGISEYILDKLLAVDPDVRYALEVQIKGSQVSLAGEITTKADVVEGDYQHWAKEAVNAIGYTKEYQHKWGVENTICGDDLIVLCNIQQQSPDIACGVNNDGWGDQGIFTGYAEISNDNYMPLDKDLAREIGLKLYNNAYMYNVGGLDIKTQITLDKDKVKQLVVAIPVMDDLELEEIRSMISFWLEVEKGINYLEDDDIIINGTGIYKQHGPIADCGTTGRKLAVDFYGNNAPIGGGCVDAETEYMSKDGWKKIKDYDGGYVGQITSDFNLELVKPEQFIKTYHENVYEIRTEKTTDMVLSDNHNILYLTSKGHLNKKKLSEILYESEQTKKGSHIDIPVTFTYNFSEGVESKYDDITTRIVVAHCADGTILKKEKTFNARIRVKKKYKIDRLRELFSKSSINFEERVYSDKYTYFYYHLDDTSKLLSEQFKNPNYKTAKILSEEVFLWDGSIKDKCFRTKKEVDADFIQFVLSGITGNFYSKLKHKTNECFTIRLVNKKITSPFRKNKTNSITKLKPQNMYCFTVPSGMLLLRRNGYIFCTGNSPWTKDGTKADLALNLFARENAVKDLIRYTQTDDEYDGADIHHVICQLCCCIGQSRIYETIKFYTKDGYLIDAKSTDYIVKPSEVIERYHLKEPIYFNLCKNGLFESDMIWNHG